MSIFDQFKRTWNDGVAGFGRHSYNDAINAGYTPAQIASAVAGKRVGRRAQDMIAAAQPAYSSGQSAGRSSARDDYQGIIDTLDEDNSGTIELSELLGWAKDQLDSACKAHKISATECAGYWEEGKKFLTDMFNSADADNNGSVDRKELDAALKAAGV